MLGLFAQLRSFLLHLLHVPVVVLELLLGIFLLLHRLCLLGLYHFLGEVLIMVGAVNIPVFVSNRGLTCIHNRVSTVVPLVFFTLFFLADEPYYADRDRSYVGILAWVEIAIPVYNFPKLVFDLSFE